jgi:hypothetical protein
MSTPSRRAGRRRDGSHLNSEPRVERERVALQRRCVNPHRLRPADHAAESRPTFPGAYCQGTSPSTAVDWQRHAESVRRSHTSGRCAAQSAPGGASWRAECGSSPLEEPLRRTKWGTRTARRVLVAIGVQGYAWRRLRLQRRWQQAGRRDGGRGDRVGDRRSVAEPVRQR